MPLSRYEATAFFIMTETTLQILQWCGCILGVAGAGLLASKSRVAGIGFIFYLASNGFWVAYALGVSSTPMLIMQGAFTITSVAGVWRWLLEPRLAAHQKNRNKQVLVKS